MSNKTRKRLWPVSLVMALAIVGIAAAFLMVASSPSSAQAHDGASGAAHCEGLNDFLQDLHDVAAGGDHTCDDPPTATPTPEPTPTATPTPEPTSPPVAPGTATELAVQLTYGAGSTVTVSWAAVTGATEYLVQYRQCTADACEGPLTSMRITDGSTSHTITSLDTSAAHQVFVTASGADAAVLSQSDPDMVCPAAPPMKFKVEALDNAARLSWKDPVDPFHMIDVKGFQIERVTYLSDPNNPILVNNRMATIDLGKVNQHWDLGLSYGVTYTYRVRAEVEITDSAGNRMMGYSLWSEPETVIVADSGGRLTPLEEAPGPVRDIHLDPACADSITVTWAAPADLGIVASRRDANGVYVGPDFIGGQGAGKVEQGKKATSVTYQVQRMVNNGPWMSVTPDGTLMYTDEHVAYPATDDDPPNVYKYRVRAKNEANLYGPWTPVEMELTKPEGVNRPQNLRATVNDAGEVVLQWTAPEGGNQTWRARDLADHQRMIPPSVPNNAMSGYLSYQVDRIIGDSVVTLVAEKPHQYGPRSFVTATNPTQVTHEQTHPDGSVDNTATSATYVVYAIVDNCQLSQGNSVTVNIETTAPGMPAGLTASASGSSVNLSWTAPSNPGSRGDVTGRVTGYQIERHSGDGNFVSIASDHSATTYTDTGLTYGTTLHLPGVSHQQFRQDRRSIDDCHGHAADAGAAERTRHHRSQQCRRLGDHHAGPRHQRHQAFRLGVPCGRH